METTAEEVSDGEQEERNQREQLPKVGVSIAERMKMFEQQQVPNNQNDAFAGFEDLTVSERGGGQTQPAKLSLSLLLFSFTLIDRFLTHALDYSSL